MTSVRVDEPRNVRDRIQIGGVIEIRDDCKACDTCTQYCPANAIINTGVGNRHKIDHDLCVNCGQCLVHCPFGKIEEVSMVDYVKDALNDPNKHVVAQTAPSVRVALGEEFGSPAGTNVEGKMFSAVRKLGFDTAWDTNFAADMTITEEGFELVERIWKFIGIPEYQEAGPLPQFTSCCPGWVRFFETRYPERLEHISSARSPVMMFGPVAKTYGAEKIGVEPSKMFNVAISPCTAKKFEVTRPEFISSGYDDVDAVITTREFAELIREKDIDFNSLEDSKADKLMGEQTGAAIIFGNTGGVMEAALRTAYYALSGEELTGDAVNFMAVRGEEEVREASVEIPIKALGGTPVKVTVAIIHGSKNVEKIWKRIDEDAKLDANDPNKKNYVFVEVMNCPGGCINGGGQPIRRDI
ncbi:MAG: 4Fe-4S binding protein [Actinomycetaceae bacterium]|nr:4Fe-4S binding protein [Actinomycetaceae bacterium]